MDKMSADGWHEVIEKDPVSRQTVSDELDTHMSFLEFTEDGETLLLGTNNLVDRTQRGSLRLYTNPEVAPVLEKFTARHFCQSPVTAGAFLSPKELIVAEDTGLVVTYQLGEVEGSVFLVPQHQTPTNDSWISALSVCCGREDVVVGGADRRINVLEKKGSALRTSYYPAHGQAVSSVAASPSDNFIFASCSLDKTVLLWDFRLARPAKALVNGPCGYTALVWRDGNELAVGSETGMVHIYDIRSEKSLHDLPLQTLPVRKLALSHSGVFLSSCSDSPDIRLWRFDTSRIISTKEQHSAFVTGLAWHPKKECLYSCGLDGVVLCHSFK